MTRCYATKPERRIDGARIADGLEHRCVGRAVAIGETVREIEMMLDGDSPDDVRLGLRIGPRAREMPRPEIDCDAVFFASSTRNQIKLGRVDFGCEPNLSRECAREWSERAADQYNSMSLQGVPLQSSQAIVENRQRAR
jgi:hypothetical protein